MSGYRHDLKSIRGVTWLALANFVAAVLLNLLEGAFQGGASDSLSIVCYASMTAQVQSAAIAAALIPSRRWLGLCTAVAFALVLVLVKVLASRIQNPLLSTSQVEEWALNVLLHSLFLYAISFGCRILLSWRIATVRDFSHSITRQFSLMDLIEWMVAISMLCALAKLCGGFDSPIRFMRHWLWQTCPSLPLALAIVAASRWTSLWMLAAGLAAFTLRAIFSHKISWAWSDPVAYTIVVMVVTQIFTIAANFLALRWIGYRLVVPARQSHVAVT